MSLHIVLFEPEIPQNTGNIARTCAALGSTLHLVHPLGFNLESKYVKRAGLDYWHLLQILQWENISDFLENHRHAPLWFFTTKAEKNYTEVTYEEDTYLVFGKETAGIPEEILIDYEQRCVRIPMIDQARSLNLSNTVAIAAYEYHRQNQFKGLQLTGSLHRLAWPHAQ